MRGDQPSWGVSGSSSPVRSPHARGSTGILGNRLVKQDPFPACAGINRRCAMPVLRRRPVPRMRGDQPPPKGPEFIQTPRSPHARGSTDRRRRRADHGHPFPACAGINRLIGASHNPSFPVPRMRGDQPVSATTPWPKSSRSPHARGSTGSIDRLSDRHRPFPACAGINRSLPRSGSPSETVPRMRGDQPPMGAITTRDRLRSPQARGSTAAGSPPA